MSSEIAPAGQNRRMSSVAIAIGSLIPPGDEEILNDNPEPQHGESKFIDKVGQKLTELKKVVSEGSEEEALKLAKEFLVEDDLKDFAVPQLSTNTAPNNSSLEEDPQSSSNLLLQTLTQMRKDMLVTHNMLAVAYVQGLFEVKKKEKQATVRQRCTITGAVEVADEATDIVVTVQYFTGVASNFWAGWVMVGFMVANRLAQFITSLGVHESWKRSLESILGIRAITDTYYMITQGPNAKIGGSIVPMVLIQGMRIGISLALESLPQVSNDSH